MPIDKMGAPIPGENFTRDTKNLPWHRPTEVDDLDKGLELVSKKVFSDSGIRSISLMLQNGATVVDCTQILLMSGIMSGKWTLDYALMMAGPTSHMIYIMAKSEGIDCEMGIDDKASDVNPASIMSNKKDAAQYSLRDRTGEKDFPYPDTRTSKEKTKDTMGFMKLAQSNEQSAPAPAPEEEGVV